MEGTGILMCEASEIGLKPGEWPHILIIYDDQGNRPSFAAYLQGFDRVDGEIMSANYKNQGFPEVRILND